MFRSLRNQAKSEPLSANNNYLKHQLGSLKNTARLWSELRALDLAKSKAHLPQLDFSLDDFNTFSLPLISPLAPHLTLLLILPPLLQLIRFPLPLTPLSRLYPILPPSLSPTSRSMPCYALYVTDPSTPRGPIDPSINRFILHSLPITFLINLDIINFSFTTSIFPSTWKLSHIILFPKTKHPSDPSHFRPISLRNFLSKVLKRIAFEQLLSHLQRSELLDPLQIGFRSGNSTQTALLKLMDIKFDKRKVTLLSLFNFTKAFDSVSHRLLLRKLKSFRLSSFARRWIKLYLIGRYQSPDCSFSSWAPINAEVSQGPVLGPLIFPVH